MSNILEWDECLPDSPYLKPNTKYSNTHLDTTSLNSDVIPKHVKNPYYRSQSSLSEATNEDLLSQVEKLINEEKEKETEKQDKTQINQARITIPPPPKLVDDDDNVVIINIPDEDNEDDDEYEDDGEDNMDIGVLNKSPTVKFDAILESKYHEDIKNEKSKNKKPNKSRTAPEFDLEEFLALPTPIINEAVLGNTSSLSSEIKEWRKEMYSRIVDLVRQIYKYQLIAVDSISRQQFYGDIPITMFYQNHIHDTFSSLHELERIQIKDIYHGIIYLTFSPDGSKQSFNIVTSRQIYKAISNKITAKYKNIKLFHQTLNEGIPAYRYIVRRFDDKKTNINKYRRYRPPVKYLEKEHTILTPLYKREKVRTIEPIN